jgi:hypothetical protein
MHDACRGTNPGAFNTILTNPALSCVALRDPGWRQRSCSHKRSFD